MTNSAFVSPAGETGARILGGVPAEKSVSPGPSGGALLDMGSKETKLETCFHDLCHPDQVNDTTAALTFVDLLSLASCGAVVLHQRTAFGAIEIAVQRIAALEESQRC